jgi:hypothetical protein
VAALLWPLAGFLVMPWTTLGYVLVRPGGIEWFDWLILAIAVVAVVSAWGSGGCSPSLK